MWQLESEGSVQAEFLLKRMQSSLCRPSNDWKPTLLIEGDLLYSKSTNGNSNLKSTLTATAGVGFNPKLDTMA